MCTHNPNSDFFVQNFYLKNPALNYELSNLSHDVNYASVPGQNYYGQMAYADGSSGPALGSQIGYSQQPISQRAIHNLGPVIYQGTPQRMCVQGCAKHYGTNCDVSQGAVCNKFIVQHHNYPYVSKYQ